ncbi:MAG: penicillin-binding protein 2 [bacterium]|nr:penicillin-binding protein 2 [bacterium]MDO8496390.1 penicillin-binding protein 2 [bacterium]
MKRYGNFRINLFLIGVVLVSGLVLYRLFVLSIIRHSAYSLTAQAQNENISNILVRGNIYMSDKNSDMVLSATNRKFPLAYIIPRDIDSDKKDKVAEELVTILGISGDELKLKIDTDSSSIKVVARRITNEQVEQIKGLKLKGVGVSYETDRFYPGISLGANIVGFLGYDTDGRRAGQYGIEGYYNADLSGKDPDVASLFKIADPSLIFKLFKQFFKKDDDSVITEPTFDRPADIVLTLDKNVQTFVEDKLKMLMEKWNAVGGTMLVQDPKSGRILAMADWPTFDPNNYSNSNPSVFLNQSIQGVYEPGSSFKPVTMSAGIDLSKITPQTTYDDVGYVNIAGYTIHNFSEKVFGRQTMAQVLEKSINTGTMFVENTIGDDNFLNYVINMGFGQKTGVDLPGEVSGDITNLYSGRKINYLTASFGQGIAVTPLQLINAYSAIANGGKLMRPYIVDRIIKEGGKQIVVQPEVVGIPISEKTAIKLQSMLVSVVDNGFDKARIAGYDIAGKTGTAQIPDGRGSYSDEEFIHNFVGFAPAYDAKFAILIKMDRPKGIAFAADSLSPTFKEIASFLLNYYNIPPSRK